MKYFAKSIFYIKTLNFIIIIIIWQKNKNLIKADNWFLLRLLEIWENIIIYRLNLEETI